MKNRRSLATQIAAVILIGAAAYFARSKTPSPPTELADLPTSTPKNVVPTASPSSVSQILKSRSAPLPNAGDETALKLSERLAAQFESLKKEALDAIPTQSQLSKLDPENVHFTPKPVLDAAIKMGDVAQILKDHPELSNKGLEFYRQCAEAETSPTSIRASCYAEFKRLSKTHSSPVAEPRVPKPVKDLALKIMA